VEFQKENDLDVDGEIGPQTRRALFPLVALTLNVIGVRMAKLGSNSQRPGFNLPQLTAPSLTPPTLTLPSLNAVTPSLVSIPGFVEPIAAAPIAGLPMFNLAKNWQQFAQTQRQFTGLFRGPFVDSFAIGAQTVFNQSDDDNHVEVTPGCLLQSPIGFTDPKGNNFTLACFANVTWVDPILHFGMFHLANPYAQIQAQGNLSGPVLPTLQLGVFPANINVDLWDSGIQFNINGGATWGLTVDGNSLKSSWGAAAGIGFTGQLRLFGN
jgi:hypothetical protein